MRRIATLVAVLVTVAGCAAGTSDGTTTTQADTTTSTTVLETTTTTQPPETTTTTAAATTTTEGETTREFSYIDEVGLDADGTVTIVADYAQFLTGDEANEAAVEAGYIEEGDSVPNDYFIVNENPKLRNLVVDPAAPVSLNVCFVDGDCIAVVEVTVDQWFALFHGETPDGLPDGFQWISDPAEIPEGVALPYWLTLNSDGVVVAIEEQFLP